MKTIYGVSSATPSNKKLKNGYTLYDWVMRQKGFPAFWGRTLLGKNAMTEEEIAFLNAKDCKISLVVRDLSEEIVSGTNGTEDAVRAANAARALGVPQNVGIAIFAEIQSDWSINHNWMISFAETLVSNGYIPGFIGNTDSSKNFNFDRQCSHYVHATEDVNQFDAIYCATEPKLGEIPKEWVPYCPSALEPENMQLWMCDKTTFGEFEVDDVYARSKEILANMW